MNNDLFFAEKFKNAIRIADDDGELIKDIISTFNHVLVSVMRSPEFPRFSLFLYTDYSAAILAHQDLYTIEPGDFFNVINTVSKKYPEEVISILKQIDNAIKTEKEINGDDADVYPLDDQIPISI